MVLSAWAGAKHGSANPAAPRGEAGTSTAVSWFNHRGFDPLLLGKGVKAVGMETEGTPVWGREQVVGVLALEKRPWGWGETCGRERGSKTRILQVANSPSDRTAPAQQEPISRQWPPRAAAPPWSSEPGRVNTSTGTKD